MKTKTLLVVAAGIMLGVAERMHGFAHDPREPHGNKRLVLDVAIDCRTWRFNSGVVEFARGDGFISNGTIFPAGTIGDGAQPNDPDDAGSIGRWYQRGTMAATAPEIMAGARPAFFATWYHLFPDDSSGLIVEGPHPEFGPMAIVGGMGRFRGATGQLMDEIIGTNITGCPNLRLTFRLQRAGE